MLLLYSTRSGPEGSSLREGGTLQYRDESPQLWGRLGTRWVGTGERSSNNSRKEPLNRRFISGKPEGIVDGQLNLTGLEWPNIKTEEYLCAMLKADVNLMSVGSEVKRRGAKQRLIIYSWLFTHDRRSPSWGVNNMEWPQISGDAAQLLHLLHCSAPDSAFKNGHTGCVRRLKWLQWTIEGHGNMCVNSLATFQLMSVQFNF